LDGRKELETRPGARLLDGRYHLQEKTASKKNPETSAGNVGGGLIQQTKAITLHRLPLMRRAPQGRGDMMTGHLSGKNTDREKTHLIRGRREEGTPLHKLLHKAKKTSPGGQAGQTR